MASFPPGRLRRGTITRSRPPPSSSPVERGRANFGLNDEEWVDVGEGDFLYIPADLPHSTANIGDTPVHYVLARAAPEDIVTPVE